MTCRKRVTTRLRCEGLILRRETCRGSIDDDGRCRRCGGVARDRRHPSRGIVQ